MTTELPLKTRPIMKSWVAWLMALWIALAIHVDWHLGRPGEHHNLSFHLPYHWVCGIIVFAQLAWFISRRWPESFAHASRFIILVGALIGQGLEPLSEVFERPMDWSPFTNMLRWRVFIEFMVAGIVTYLIVARLVQARRTQVRT